ncbi:MAG TPA: thermonuclease family protein [Rhizomicrobium sp.]|nr:thermonuclease family protein [Rhizomicrobium sp.]
MRIARITYVLSYGAIWAAIWFPLDAYAASQERFISDCAGRIAIAHARVLRVEQGGGLVLPDGRALQLEGIRLPLDGPRDLADRARAALSSLALSGSVSFTADPPSNDRYGRLRVQAFGREWLQIALLEQGLARAAISPDRTECAPDLYEAEARGRAKRAGLWALPVYRIRTPQDVKGATGSFQLVEGVVSHIGRADGRTFLDFGGKGRWSFSALIAPGDRRAFRDFDLDGLAGRHVRIRGIVQDYRGRPEIALSNPSQIEVLN